MSDILVIGHRNPDTDAICSAIGYAEFKRRTGLPGAIAARCGDTNERIDFVLNTFGVPAPKFVADVSPKVRDVMVSQVISVPLGATVAAALGVMDEHNIRVVQLTPGGVRLTITRIDATTVRLAWPVAAGNFILQCTANVAVPNPWPEAGLPISVEGSDHAAYDTIGSGNKFYRLSQQ